MNLTNEGQGSGRTTSRNKKLRVHGRRRSTLWTNTQNIALRARPPNSSNGLNNYTPALRARAPEGARGQVLYSWRVVG